MIDSTFVKAITDLVDKPFVIDNGGKRVILVPTSTGE